MITYSLALCLISSRGVGRSTSWNSNKGICTLSFRRVCLHSLATFRDFIICQNWTMIYLPALQALVEIVGDEELTPTSLCLHIVQKHHSFTSTKPCAHMYSKRLVMKEGTQKCVPDGCYVPFEHWKF